MEIVDHPDHRLIRLAGRLAEAQVPELLSAHAAAVHNVQLHLGDLISVDTVGLDALCGLQRAGAQFLDVPTYIQLKLDSLSAKRAVHRRI
jgi:ABC-type transporter Mla MlaB component